MPDPREFTQQPVLGDFHEKEFIRQVLGRFASTAQGAEFDDCIVVDLAEITNIPSAPYLVYSMDHPGRIKRPLPEQLGWRFYGRWVAACTCGDVLAMGAKPRGFSLDLAVDIQVPVQAIEEFYTGVTDILALYGVRFEGGNLDVGGGVETVGMCWGIVDRSRIIRRRGAAVGDTIVVTTQPGIGWASFLTNRRGLWHALGLELQELLTNYNVMPIGPLNPLQHLLDAHPEAISSGMDLTDGLIEFLYTIAEGNNVQVLIRQAGLPVSPTLSALAEVLRVRPEALTLEPGYDTPRIHGYTIKTEFLEEAKSIFGGHGFDLIPVGSVVAGSGVIIEMDTGELRPIPWFCDDQFLKSSVDDRWAGAIGSFLAEL